MHLGQSRGGGWPAARGAFQGEGACGAGTGPAGLGQPDARTGLGYRWGLSSSYDSIHVSLTLVNRIHYPIVGDKSKRLMSLGFSSLIDIGIDVDTCIDTGICIHTHIPTQYEKAK